MKRRYVNYLTGFIFLLLTGFTMAGTTSRAIALTREQRVDSYLTKDMDITPKEPASSDLEVVQPVTKLDFHRWIQSFTMDSKYYYFMQMTSGTKGHLRITRVKYKGLGRYLKDHMDLMYFGHGTNLDCAVDNGVTWLWTGSSCASGSDVTRAVTCFKYKKNSVLRNHGKYTYYIPKGRNGKYVTNVYPAVNEKNNRLAVRFTYRGKQHFQTYRLTNGCKINNRQPLNMASFPQTAADFQGFDIYGNKSIYTIEGSPTAVFLSRYDKSRIFKPTIIRRMDLGSGSQLTPVKIKGAKKLPFREPEGIKARKGKELYIMFVSFRLTDQSCNIYKVK